MQPLHEERRVGASARSGAPTPMTAQLLADAQRVLRSCAGGSAAQLAQRSLAQQVAHRFDPLRGVTRLQPYLRAGPRQLKPALGGK